MAGVRTPWVRCVLFHQTCVFVEVTVTAIKITQLDYRVTLVSPSSYTAITCSSHKLKPIKSNKLIR